MSLLNEARDATTIPEVESVIQSVKAALEADPGDRDAMDALEILGTKQEILEAR